MRNKTTTPPIGFKSSYMETAELFTPTEETKQNLYLVSILKAFQEFLIEEQEENECSESRLERKIKCARTLFPEDRKALTLKFL